MPRPIDHLVLAAHDLAAQAEFYRRLGFTVGARNTHPWGTQNHIVQLHGAFLELISHGPGYAPPPQGHAAEPFAGFIEKYLRHREGLAMLVLQSRNAAQDASAFAATGIAHGETLRFGRQATRPNGEKVDVGFALAFAHSPLIEDAGFFVCQNLHPENFWSLALQIHPNGAQSVKGVMMVAENPADHAEFLGHFTGQREMAATSMGLAIDTGGGLIEVLTPAAYRFRTGLEADAAPPIFAAYRIGVAQLAVTKIGLERAGIDFHAHGGALVAPPSCVFGAAILFEPA